MLPDLFFNNARRLRSGWRFLIFFTALLALVPLLREATAQAKSFFYDSAGAGTESFIASGYGFIVQGVLLTVIATFTGWLCGRLLESLPLSALGWTLHSGWMRDLLLGTLVGATSLLFAVCLIVVSGGYRFAFNSLAPPSAILYTLLFSMIVFVIGAAGEEAMFRGYALQTLLRSHTVLLAALPASVFFAVGHLANPNVAAGWTFLNTLLAGIWLAVAYWRTRSLWFPLGVHWAWNWTMAAVLGTPVSGITNLTPQPLLRATETGADWFTGGAYGIEGGAACAIVLILSTVLIWRTPLLSANEQLRSFTDAEQPSTQRQEELTAVDIPD